MITRTTATVMPTMDPTGTPRDADVLDWAALSFLVPLLFADADADAEGVSLEIVEAVDCAVTCVNGEPKGVLGGGRLEGKGVLDIVDGNITVRVGVEEGMGGLDVGGCCTSVTVTVIGPGILGTFASPTPADVSPN
jgi:hypothetical protein